jgi:hypothetical protein
MARTLGCLVASMTAGAVVLEWVQPDRPATQARAVELIARGGTVTGQWEGIRIDPYRDGMAEPDRFHFMVDTKGNYVRTGHWLSQKPLTGRPEVRIGLQSSSNSNQITMQQLAATKELVAALRQVCGIRSSAYLDDTIAIPDEPVAQASRPTPASGRLSR